MSSHRPEIEISTVTPLHNELCCVREFVRQTDAALAAMRMSYEIIVVNDGSTDGTGELLQELTAEFSHLRLVTLNRRFGRAIAIDAGVQNSVGQSVVILDGDLEQPPEEIPQLVRELQNGCDLVCGRATQRPSSSILRNIPSRIGNWLLRRITGCDVQDMGGIKALRGEVARSLRLSPGQDRFLPTLVEQQGGRVAVIPVSASPRFAGRTHDGLGRIVDVILDVAHIWFQTAAKGRPVYLLGRISLGLVAVTGSLLLSAVVSFAMSMSASAWTLALFATGSGLCSVGCLAVGVGLELLIETHKAAITGRRFQVAQVEDDVSESATSSEPMRRVA